MSTKFTATQIRNAIYDAMGDNTQSRAFADDIIDTLYRQMQQIPVPFQVDDEPRGIPVVHKPGRVAQKYPRQSIQPKNLKQPNVYAPVSALDVGDVDDDVSVLEIPL